VRLSRVAAVAIGVALVGLSACGGDSKSLLGPPPPPGKPATLVGTWQTTQPRGYKLRYVFRRDGTYTHFSGNRQKRKRGTYRFAIRARGTVTVRGRTLVLRPRNATIERHDPDDPGGDFKRSLAKRVQRYEWLVRGTGKEAKLTMRIGGRLALTYRRR
jgi:hypothetical protein